MAEVTIALQAALVSIDETKQLLGRSLERASSNLSREASAQLTRAAMRSLTALQHVREFLAESNRKFSRSRLEGEDEAPPMELATATLFLRDLDSVIAKTEMEILRPVEQVLLDDERRELRRCVGQLWGWIVCDLQDPLWRQYPDLAPKRREA